MNKFNFQNTKISNGKSNQSFAHQKKNQLVLKIWVVYYTFFSMHQSNFNQTKLSFFDEKMRNESMSLGSTSSDASKHWKCSGPTVAAIFLTAARHATKTPSLPILEDSFLQSSTSRLNPSRRTTSSASAGSLHSLKRNNQNTKH